MIKGAGFTEYVLNMTSQTWLTAADSDRSVWWHFMAIIIPDHVEFKTTGMNRHFFFFPILSKQPIFQRHGLSIKLTEGPNVFIGTLYITGNSNTDAPPNGQSEDEELCYAIALTDHVVCAVIWQVPNQPIVFTSDPTRQPRSEDAMVAWTWYHYININSSDPFWLARLPMTKVTCYSLVELNLC